ncbi:hypothetical protein [Thalassobius sp. Cn5-15]|uniref:hypothetical protein n=1 Tax=Thalassobius sp. Cn5-15 TaxID=2917763 RepID=UPI001EF2072E|nr:hypothetical protein [Thalassobius sp. Cn5-15]MCG7494757.1 hypothetical protein [Thalassobius sp. Cn5-15]
MRFPLICLMGVMALTACDRVTDITHRSSRVLFEDKFYPTQLSAVGGDNTAFAVNVDRIEQGVDAAREAGRHRATKYCVTEFGKSDVVWINGPDDAAADLVVSNGSLTLRGRCDV